MTHAGPFDLPVSFWSLPNCINYLGCRLRDLASFPVAVEFLADGRCSIKFAKAMSSYDAVL